MVQILGLLALAWLALSLLIFLLQRTLIYFPTPAPAGGDATGFWLETPHARLRISAETRETGAPAILYFGGNAEDVALTLPALAGQFPAHALYLMHYRGYGGSSGRPFEEGLVTDALALFDEVRGRHTDIVVIGRSLGSGVAVQLAARRPVQRLVLVTPFDSLRAVAKRHYPWLPVGWLLRDRFESVVHAPSLRMPTRLIAAGQDEVIDPMHARRLFEAFAPGVARLDVVPQAGHNDISLVPVYGRLLREAVAGP
ncbi:MAG: hypothetical protein EP306_08525 [Burkholderiales bacterium]|nr:MAG: hypothetical protein EP306_08525 [Burkholderiales bacterium]